MDLMFNNEYINIQIDFWMVSTTHTHQNKEDIKE